jgi:hypothetical protein
MRTAVIVNGQERGLRRTVNLLKKNLLMPNDAVMFLACESGNAALTAAYFQGAHYGGSMILPSLRDTEFNAFMQFLESSGRPAITPEAFTRSGEPWSMSYLHGSGTVIQYYQVWKAWQMILDYERTNNMRFDVVVRCRPDSILTERLDLSLPYFGSERIRSRQLGSSDVTLRDNNVVTFGQEQFWVARRDVFALLGPMVFTYGTWDSGGLYPFNSESFFSQFCKANHISHDMFHEAGEMFNFSHPGDEEVTTDPMVFSLLR